MPQKIITSSSITHSSQMSIIKSIKFVKKYYKNFTIILLTTYSFWYYNCQCILGECVQNIEPPCILALRFFTPFLKNHQKGPIDQKEVQKNVSSYQFL